MKSRTSAVIASMPTSRSTVQACTARFTTIRLKASAQRLVRSLRNEQTRQRKERTMDKTNKCPFCDNPNCHITKAQVLARGPILERNADYIMHDETDEYPRLYTFKGVPALITYSALFPDPDEPSPHVYNRVQYDEDFDSYDGWLSCDIDNPMEFPTEAEMLNEILSNNSLTKIKEIDCDA